MTPQKLFTEITTGKFRSVYYFYGPEDYRIVEAEKYIAHQFLPERQLAINYRRIDARRTNCTDLLSELSVYPMLGERQVVAIHDFQRYKPTEVERILKLLEPSDPNRLVILSSSASRTPKKNSAFFRTVSGVAEDVEFRKLSRTETANLIVRKLAKASLTAEQEALDMLTELVAGNRGALEVEMDKLIDYKDSGQAVTAEDVQRIAAGFQVYNVFQLADDVVGGDVARVLRQVEHLLADGNTPTGILFFLGQHFISLYLVKSGRPLDPRRRFLAPKFRGQASKYETAQLERIIIDIAEADALLRRPTIKPEFVLEQLVLNLMRPGS